MTKKVVDFKPAAAARRAARDAQSAESRARAVGEPRRWRAADGWVASAASAEAEIAASVRPRAPEPPPVGPEIAESLGQLQRELATALRAPAERHVAGLVRLASCRTPAELLAAQVALANELVSQGFTDAARIAECWARTNRATARIFMGGWG